MRQVAHALLDRKAWGRAGQAEFAFVTAALRSLGALNLMRITIASLALMMVPLAVVSETPSWGPRRTLLLRFMSGRLVEL